MSEPEARATQPAPAVFTVGPTLAAVGPLLPMMRRAVDEWVTVERALCRLIALCPPHAIVQATAEAKRRARESPLSEAAAYDSVADDLQAGRWHL